jgi:3-oxoacyl-[acyl-carrier protein] reductase
MKNKVILITGGTRGIGRSIVDNLLQEGCKLAVVYRNESPEYFDLIDYAKKMDMDILFLKGDVSNSDFTKSIPKKVYDYFGKLDCVICNAGISSNSLIGSLNIEDTYNIIQINLLSSINLAKESIKFIDKGGSILFMGSMAGKHPKQGNSIYCATKAALGGFVRIFASFAIKKGVRVNIISPSFFRTELIDEMDPNLYNFLLKTTALSRIGETRELIGLVKFILSDESSYIVGQNIGINGGYLL